MSDWVEARAAELLAASGGDPERLLILLEPGITVWDCPAGEACCVHWGIEEADVRAPVRDSAALHEELGHALCTYGYGRRLAREGAPTARTQRLRDEAIARRFAARFAAAFEDD